MSCHSYIFFDIESSIKSLSDTDLAAYKERFCAAVEEYGGVTAAAYATLGFKANNRFMLHLHAAEADMIQRFVQSLLHTALGKHLTITYTLLGLVKPSQYNPNTKTPPEEKEFKDGTGKYLIVYPFTKTLEWHAMPFEERREIMKEHVMTARKFIGSISQLLLYAYGVDDHEFIVSYQTDSLPDFQALVMALRDTKGRIYTKNDTPIFVGTYMSLPEALEML